MVKRVLLDLTGRSELTLRSKFGETGPKSTIVKNKFVKLEMAGRPAAPRQITQFVMPAVQLSAVDITPRELYGVMRDKYEWLQWLARHRLIKNKVDCGVCNR